MILAAAGCAETADRPAKNDAEAECQPQVRLGDQVYEAWSYTDQEPGPMVGDADAADCDDVGEEPEGAVFPENPEQVPAWSFRGFPTDQVIGVRFDQDTFTVFINEAVPQRRAEAISTELGKPH